MPICGKMGRKGKIPAGEDYLSEWSKPDLIKLYKSEKDGKAKLRLLACIHRKDGKTMQEIADILFQSKMTVHDWLSRIYYEGIENILDDKKSGRPANLTKNQLEKLESALEKKPVDVDIPSIIWTAKLVRFYIVREFDIKYSISQVRRILNSLNFTLKKPRPSHRKANKELQEEFKKTLDPKLRDMLKMDSRSYYWTKQSVK